MANTIVWADIPVTDMDRARAFYGALLQTEIPLMEGADGSVALLPGDMGKMVGTIAFILDSEGNRIGLHHPPAM
jgi:predicted enzyme related to lactoylglutathione lyase